MPRRWAGLLVALFVFGGVLAVVLANLDLSARGRGTGVPKERGVATGTSDVDASVGAVDGTRAGGASMIREYPIGDPVLKNNLEVASVWLPAVQMAGMPPADPSMIHLEADVKATENNPHGFGNGSFVPWLTIHYQVTREGDAEPLHTGELLPMEARDGPHYGASLLMPRPGRYRLALHVDPPNIGRHVDPLTGIPPWWPPFDAVFDWDYEGPPTTTP